MDKTYLYRSSNQKEETFTRRHPEKLFLRCDRRKPPDSIAGKGKILGDIVNPIVDEDEWECLK